ncbi:glycoside hydrolase family 15 protein [Candidatus Babeliales bacterium]|nr:glycoside hydrolase family 15 protein [Candidatus Babeliales bacterium]
MARYFTLGNGKILICLDKNAQIRDFYFPYVGQENHVNGNIHKFGVWADSEFFWLDSDSWEKKLSYKKDTLTAQVEAFNKKLEVKLSINDTVHCNKNIYLRKVIVTNKSTKEKEVKLFLHQIFQITGNIIGNTAYYNPILKAIVFYKGKRYFLINGLICNEEKHGISSYTTGIFFNKGYEGSFIDAQDGKLCNNPIEHGSVDSVISFNIKLSPNESQTLYYWICAGTKNGTITKLNDYVLKHGPENLIKKTEKYWIMWVNRTNFNFYKLDDSLVDLFKRSLLIVNTHVDKQGAFIAAGDSSTLYRKKDTYAYMWPRDGALIARSLDRAGYKDMTENFFTFCCKALTKDGYLFHKYNADGSLGSSWHPWIHEDHLQLPIQEDQLALVLDAMWKHYAQYKNEKYMQNIFKNFIKHAANFMYNFFDKELGLPKESYDLWEEKLGIHTFTCSTVYAGLMAAGKFEKTFGIGNEAEKYFTMAQNIKNNVIKYLYDENEKRFIKSIYYHKGKIKKDKTVDSSSSYGIFEFKLLPPDDPKILSSFESFKEKLLNKTPVGGYARYENDDYYRVNEKGPGNPWFITILWLAEYYIVKAKNEEDLKPAIEIFNWVNKNKLETGILSEQLNPNSGQPLSVAPLTWSHAAYIIAVNKYLEKLDSLGIIKMVNPPKIKNNNKKI